MNDLDLPSTKALKQRTQSGEVPDVALDILHAGQAGCGLPRQDQPSDLGASAGKKPEKGAAKMTVGSSYNIYFFHGKTPASKDSLLNFQHIHIIMEKTACNKVRIEGKR